MDSAEDKNLDYQKGTVSAMDLHAAARREDSLQRGGKGGVGITVLIVAASILIFGGGNFVAGVISAKHYVPESRPMVGGAGAGAATVAWIDTWEEEGKKVYGNCVACHQAEGQGVPGIFPPLAGSEWVNGGTKRLAAIVLHGVTGPITVAGQTYDNPAMQPWAALGDEKVAQVITFVKRNFGSLPEGDDGVVTTEMVKAAREEFSSQTAQFVEAELLAIPADENLPGPKVNLETGEAL